MYYIILLCIFSLTQKASTSDKLSKDRNYVSSVIREYRVTLPLSVDEYRIGQLYGVAEASKRETGGGEGVEIIINEPREEVIPGEASGKVMKSQYTHKILHLESKMPAIIRKLAPTGSLTIHEKSWNAYPYTRTVYTNDYMRDGFHIVIETRHKPGKGDIENVHNLNGAQLQKRIVDKVDIVNDKVDPRDYKPEEDPTKFSSAKTGRGPLPYGDWQSSQNPIMTCYKLYHIEFKWRGLQPTVENMIVRSVRRLLFNFGRQVFCWIDQWYGMSIEQIREYEEKTKRELDELRATGEVRGMSEQ